jgi:hypothetical protein
MARIHRHRFSANGLVFLLGNGHFVSSKIIEVQLASGSVRRIERERIFLDVGTYATILIFQACPPQRR